MPPPPGGGGCPQVLFCMCLSRENFQNFLVHSHKASASQILHVAVSSGPLPRVLKLYPRGQIGKTLEISLYLAIRPRAYQILHVALSSGPSPRGVNYSPRVELIAMGHKFYWVYIVKFLEIFLLVNIRTMTTSFSPVLGALCFKPITKYCIVWYDGILCISHWSDTGPSWPSC